MSRNECIEQIKTALKKRSKTRWSVRGGSGTAYGWIRVTTIPSLRNGCSLAEEHRKELAQLFGLEGERECWDGISIAASDDYYQEYVERANGQAPTKIAQPYWD